MKSLLFTFAILVSTSLCSQNLELIGGINSNRFFDLEDESPHFNSEYEAEQGYGFRLGFDGFKVDWLPLRFTLGIENYQGKAKIRDGGQGGSYTTDLEIVKSTISLGIFLANFNFIENMDINLGVEISRLLSESASGSTSGSVRGQPNFTNDISKSSEKISAATTVGLKGRIAYDIKIDDQWAVSPQYSYYFGLTNEFKDFNAATRSMRHYFSIGLQRKLKTK